MLRLLISAILAISLLISSCRGPKDLTVYNPDEYLIKVLLHDVGETKSSVMRICTSLHPYGSIDIIGHFFGTDVVQVIITIREINKERISQAVKELEQIEPVIKVSVERI
jgi:hypothetical protein